MSAKRLVILGGTGFVGSYLVPRLAMDGHRIVLLSRNRERRRALAVVPGVEIHSTDVYDGNALRRQFEGADAVIHMIGSLHPASGRSLQEIHVELARRVTGACQAAGVGRLHLMSALKAGQGLSRYLKTRGEAEAVVRQSGLDWTIYQSSVMFGANDGLVSNLSLVMGMAATGVGSGVVLLSGISGLLAGAFSMGAGEFVSVRSQRELLAATRPTQVTLVAAPQLDIEHNELLLVYLARGMSREAAEHRVAERMGLFTCDCDPSLSLHPELPETEDEHEAVGTAWGAALSSFCFFASGAIVPIIPFLFGVTGIPALITAAVLVAIALLATGGTVGLLSGTSPLTRGLRQLAIGLGAAGVTYLLGVAFGAVIA